MRGPLAGAAALASAAALGLPAASGAQQPTLSVDLPAQTAALCQLVKTNTTLGAILAGANVRVCRDLVAR